ncbi:hypothetical protein IIC38_01355 [candidate division KSB1 bacterium]|nr:hypothetical protein [candidate division KSB1 bacterium]
MSTTVMSQSFEVGKYYHIFNRGNNRERTFFSDENYAYFLKKFDQYLSPYLEVYSYCLLFNHFHLLVRVKDHENPSGLQDLRGLDYQRNPVSQAFSNLFNAYTKAINKQENRTGSIFQKKFKKIEIDKDSYLIRMIYYIHRNPVHHGICEQLWDYHWSSYYRMTDDKQTKLKRREVLDWFGGKTEFVNYHQSMLVDFREVQKYLIE